MKKTIFFDFYGVIKNNPNFQLNNGVLEKLNKKYNLFIISNSDSSSIYQYLNDHRWQNYFNEISSSSNSKSKSEIFRQLIEKYNLPETDTIFITDTAGDIHAAKQAKISFIIGLTGGLDDLETLKYAQPDIIINNNAEFNQAVDLT